MGLNPDFYRGRRVLITGHTGFKGSWLAIWLNHLGAVVSGIALDPVTDRDLFLLAGLEKRLSDHRADIRNLEDVCKIIEAERPETVFHLAAQSLVLEGYKDPVASFETNVTGTVNILEACRRSGSVKEVIVVTTDKVYENKEQKTGYREEDSLGGYDPYSASKACAEIVTQSYRRSFFSEYAGMQGCRAVCTVRAGNVIGGGDWASDRLIPDCVRALETGEPVRLRNPGSVRPWQHVLEPLSGYLMLGVKASVDPVKLAGAWNFGPDSSNAVSARSLVSDFISCWGSGSFVDAGERSAFHETGILLLDAGKAARELKWIPALDLPEAVRMTAEWYKSYRYRDVYDLCVEQIEYYSERWNSGSSV